jgi:hypothetical protein
MSFKIIPNLKVGVSQTGKKSVRISRIRQICGLFQLTGIVNLIVKRFLSFIIFNV